MACLNQHVPYQEIHKTRYLELLQCTLQTSMISECRTLPQGTGDVTLQPDVRKQLQLTASLNYIRYAHDGVTQAVPKSVPACFH